MSSTQDLSAGVRDGFYRIELNKTVWEIPKRYQMLSAIGTGAYGQVWCVDFMTQVNRFKSLDIQKPQLCQIQIALVR